jgi:hypothetical protein
MQVSMTGIGARSFSRAIPLLVVDTYIYVVFGRWQHPEHGCAVVGVNSRLFPSLPPRPPRGFLFAITHPFFVLHLRRPPWPLTTLLT